ncbi:uncharacterized protein MONBRDRAFT_7636 [Monosiga brevicollis MX1]|uniref:Uncharacterized protein n=1 Tax=Monosiga brevicollis TaxID=81824 RepID=A9UXV4_MONBE|nr:uncharacterized protein MONBRDRAFT_7636 [Monosiga brevicollis MX1]EDQ89911.1 predicted protein [Monosiga brevicollis MX1]|eukprot:XP_001745333.1 hypothetical protein [Monosiga brevicollis MX1]
MSPADIDNSLRFVAINVQANFATDNLPEFFRRMVELNKIWLYDETNMRLLNPHTMPTNITHLVNNPYRSLAWAVRNNAGYGKTDESFADFVWARFFASYNLLPKPNSTGAANPSYCDLNPYNIAFCYPRDAEYIGAGKPELFWFSYSW